MTLLNLISDVKKLKESQADTDYNYRNQVVSEFKRRQRLDVQPEVVFGMYTALVVDTVDPLGRGGVRWYSPYFVEQNTPVESLPWAYPVSPLGGFDDSGVTWVPPAGSHVVLFFHNGDRNSAYYFGTIWTGHRGPDSGGHLDYWNNFPVPEYENLWSGRRNGYLVGDNTGDQNFMPWNTEMYNSFDRDSLVDFYENPSQYGKITYPYVYGLKTNEKHGLKFVDGDHRCNKRWKRLELFSSTGNWLMMKDDHLHPSGQWAHGSQQNESACYDYPNLDVPKEFVCCDESTATTCSTKSCPDNSQSNSSIKKNVFANPYFKRSEEMRPYKGVNTPQNNKCELPQSGMQLQSVSGHQIVMDDSVNQPKGIPSWDRDFDFGCDDTYRGKIFIRSATGHLIEMSDKEDVSFGKVRGQENYIKMQTATGNSFEMNDHTLAEGPCTPGRAGKKRGIILSSTSKHLFQLSDEGLNQSSPIRKDGGEPKLSNEGGFEGFCLLRSGYGLQILMKDQDRQDRTSNQYIQIMAPQKENERGPHMMVFQEQAEGPGLVLLRSGGVFELVSYDDNIEVVGTNSNSANKFLSVTDNYIVDVKEIYFHHNNYTIFLSESYIFLLAGRDCQVSDPDAAASESTSATEQSISDALASPGSSSGVNKTPGVFSALVAKDAWACPYTSFIHFGIMGDTEGNPILDSRSDRVFISASCKNEEEE